MPSPDLSSLVEGKEYSLFIVKEYLFIFLKFSYMMMLDSMAMEYVIFRYNVGIENEADLKLTKIEIHDQPP